MINHTLSIPKLAKKKPYETKVKKMVRQCGWYATRQYLLKREYSALECNLLMFG